MFLFSAFLFSVPSMPLQIHPSHDVAMYMYICINLIGFKCNMYPLYNKNNYLVFAVC